MTTNALRRAVHILVVAGPVALVLAAAPAVADTPSTWEDPEPMSTLTALLIFVGGPLALAAVITVLTLGPSLVRGDRSRRGVASWTEPAWFGSEVAQSQQSRGELEGGSSATQTGGASARW